ncbi:MAG: hypothetical protein WCB68_17925 [Pyrinomonadaceae bacterium]
MSSEGKAISLLFILTKLGAARAEFGYALSEAQDSHAPFERELRLTRERIDRDIARFTTLVEQQRALDQQTGAPDVCSECSQERENCSCPEPTISLDQLEEAERIKKARRSITT